MIIRPRRNRSRSLVKRLFSWSDHDSDNNEFGIFSPGRFAFEMAREAARVNRRELKDRSFSLINLSVKENSPEQLIEFLTRFRNGLRITDSVGWLDGELSVLLPETASEGAAQVANELVRLAGESELTVETDIAEYPKDDELVQRANTLIAELAATGKVVEREQDQNKDDDDQTPSASSRAADEQARALLGRMDRVRGDQFIEFSAPFGKSFATPWWKRSLDVVCSGMGLLVLAPLFAGTAIAIKRNSPGPVFFKQRREGKDGEVFLIWKFRTMGANAESLKDDLRVHSEQDGPAFKMEDDPRITSIGKFLRKSCIDELPQLINVFRGEMSLVGPRPLPVDESVQCLDWQRHRLRVLPGITCIWQAEGGRDTQFDDWMRMDLRYLRRRSFLFDIKMIFKTVQIAVLHKGSV